LITKRTTKLFIGISEGGSSFLKSLTLCCRCHKIQG